MLQSREEGLAAREVVSRIEPLLGTVYWDQSGKPAYGPPAPPPAIDTSTTAMEGILKDLQRAAERVEEGTKAMLQATEGLKVVGSGWDTLDEDLGLVFASGRRRASRSWIVTMSMTLVAFGLLITMIATAAVMTVVTRNPWWGLLLGGASFSGVFGYLIWKPFDRVFQSTLMLAHPEMIQVQAAVNLSTASNVDGRQRVYEQAIASLEELRTTTTGKVTRSRRMKETT